MVLLIVGYRTIGPYMYTFAGNRTLKKLSFVTGLGGEWGQASLIKRLVNTFLYQAGVILTSEALP